MTVGHHGGVLEVTLLYLTSDDTSPVQSLWSRCPSTAWRVEESQENWDSVYQLDAGWNSSAPMMGGDMVEVKAVIALDFGSAAGGEPVIRGSHPSMDLQKLQELPESWDTSYSRGDSLWEIAKIP